MGFTFYSYERGLSKHSFGNNTTGFKLNLTHRLGYWGCYCCWSVKSFAILYFCWCGTNKASLQWRNLLWWHLLLLRQWLQGWYYMKHVPRYQHDKNRYSRIATVDGCFALIGARQHCVTKICNASPTANVHKLQNDPFTISSSVLWADLCPKTRAATSRVSGQKETKCQCWCLERQKNIMNVAGQQSSLNTQTHGRYHVLKT